MRDDIQGVALARALGMNHNADILLGRLVAPRRLHAVLKDLKRPPVDRQSSSRFTF